MNFSTLFRLEENLHLDKKTLVILRWIAILGQLAAICFVFFYLKLEFKILYALSVILIGFFTNLFLQFYIKSPQLKDLHASFYLIYDLIQLSLLLYFTGGIFNPFILLIIIPTIVSSTLLSMGTTIILGILSIIFLFLLTVYHQPMPGIHDGTQSLPTLFLFGFIIAIVIGLLFLSYFGIRFAGEAKRRSDAINKLQQVIAKEYELESLGGQAAAAAHSLGTPLATIHVVAGELKKDLGKNKNYVKDIDLLISQTKRCKEILKQIANKEIKEDEFYSTTKFEIILSEIIDSFREISDIKIILDKQNDKNKIDIQRTPEIIYGLRNFIGNGIKFAKTTVNVSISSDDSFVKINIHDDGPGYPEDIISLVGEPYIKSNSSTVVNKSGLGLGTFLGKNLLERKGANLKFSNSNGAKVEVTWNINAI